MATGGKSCVIRGRIESCVKRIKDINHVVKSGRSSLEVLC